MLRFVAVFLTQHDIAYCYDERLQIIDGYAIRPDFYLPGFDVYIEYWGMDTTDYKIGMLKKHISSKANASSRCTSATNTAGLTGWQRS